MKDTTTKEQLQVELGKIRQSHGDWVASDERRRKEFAKAFNWRRDVYGSMENTPSVPSWEQIFVEVGRLLENKNFMDYENTISELQAKLVVAREAGE